VIALAACSEDWLAMVLGLRADAPGTVTGAPQNWPRWAVLLPHVLAAAGHFEPSPGPREQPGRPQTSWLLDRAAAHLHVNARLGEAVPLAERALAIDEAAYDPDHPTVRILRANLQFYGNRRMASLDSREPADTCLPVSLGLP
jgi:hypothetical protein